LKIEDEEGTGSSQRREEIFDIFTIERKRRQKTQDRDKARILPLLN